VVAEVRWTPQARQDLLDIYVAIGLHQPNAAERYFSLIEEKAGRLAEQPRLGPRRSDISDDARMLVAAPFVLLYRTVPNADEGPVEVVEVVRIIDGRRDLNALLLL